jgi:hypothetical protein
MGGPPEGFEALVAEFDGLEVIHCAQPGQGRTGRVPVSQPGSVAIRD